MTRHTRQRDAIREVFLEHNGPLGAVEVLEYARRKWPRLGAATVYRALKSLLGEQWLVAVSLPGRPSLFEQNGKRHHHYFHCRTCGKCFDIFACAGDLRGLAPKGYVIENHELVLYGLCPPCAKA